MISKYSSAVHALAFNNAQMRLQIDALRAEVAALLALERSRDFYRTGYRRAHDLRMIDRAALRRVIPWLGRLIADGGHLASCAPNDAVGALQQAEAAIYGRGKV